MHWHRKGDLPNTDPSAQLLMNLEQKMTPLNGQTTFWVFRWDLAPQVLALWLVCFFEFWSRCQEHRKSNVTSFFLFLLYATDITLMKSQGKCGVYISNKETKSRPFFWGTSSLDPVNEHQDLSQSLLCFALRSNGDDGNTLNSTVFLKGSE